MFSFLCRMRLILSVTKTTNKLINILMMKRQETGDKESTKVQNLYAF